MSPPDYPSAWLHPCRAHLRFTRQVHCSSAAPCCSQLPVCSSTVHDGFQTEKRSAVHGLYPLPPCSEPKALIKCNALLTAAGHQASLTSKQSATFGRGATYI